MRYFYAMTVQRLRALKGAMYAVTYTHNRMACVQAAAAAAAAAAAIAAIAAQSLFGHTEN